MPLKRDESRPSRNAAARAGRGDQRPGGVLALQRTAGNRAVARLMADPRITVQREQLGAIRRQAFTERATGLGLEASQIDQLWQAGGTSSSDGFASAMERTAELFSAARRAAARGIPSFFVEAKVQRLAELNSTLGHSRTDDLIAKARSAMLERLIAAVGPVQPISGRAATFGFLVTGAAGAALSEATLLATSGRAAASVGQQLGLSLTAEVMDVDDAATSAVIADLTRNESAAAARSGVPAREGRDDGARFTSTGADRARGFSALAESFGLEPATASELYGMLLGGRPDPLTGFEGDADRVGTVRKAAAEAKRGTAAVYVEVDVRNLGGLNRALGRRKADAVFARMASIVDRELREVSGLGDTWPFRHGGDEFSFVIVGRRRGISAGQLEFAVGAALTRATNAIGAITSELGGIAHTKPTGRGGTGIVWGTSTIGPGEDPATVFAAADRKVEQKKRPPGGLRVPV